MQNTNTTSVYWTNSFNFPKINPKVYLAINRNRIKTYLHDDELCVYLKDGTEFQLEFYNDSDIYIKAEISINGKPQNNSLVLKPYQRFYLDRFLDEKSKFKFNIFLTGNDNIEELKEIIKNNGRIEVKFYTENMFVVPLNSTSLTISNQNLLHNSDYFVTNLNYKNNVNDFSVETDIISTYDVTPKTDINKNKEIETGRIEAGKKSDQDIVLTYRIWNKVPFSVFSFHIMPESQKPTNNIKSKKQKNIIQTDKIRTYCANCGRRVKKGFNFCPGCGEKI